MTHDGACACSYCQAVHAEAVEVAQEDCDRMADEWARWVGTTDGEVHKLRAGEQGRPGSYRWVALQAIARARQAATAPRDRAA